MRHKHCMTWNMMRKTEKREKREMHTVGPGIWRENLKITENEKYTLQDVKYASKTEKGGKFRNVHCRTWNMARKLKIMKMRNIHLTT